MNVLILDLLKLNNTFKNVYNILFCMTKLLVVADSCSLILLAKAKILDITCEEFKVEIPEKVFEEVIKMGKKLGKLDAFIIEKKIKSGSILVKKINKIKKIQLKQFNLDKGEEEAILLSIEDKADLIIIDDKQAINTAKLLGLDWISTPILIQGFYERKKISKYDAFDALAIIQREGRYKLDFILGILKSIEGGIK